jgi:biotin carboxylase
MRILVLHKIAYARIQYHKGIDHDLHDVTYVGTGEKLANIPQDLRCTRVTRPGRGAVAEEIIALRDRLGPGFDRVISMTEMELLDAAAVREAFDVPGPRVSDVLKVRDKLLMKQLVREAGLRVPEFLPLSALDTDEEPRWSGATIVKPVDGLGSERVMRADSMTAVRHAYAAMKASANNETNLAQVKRYEIEEFVAGDILHFDGLAQDGNYLLLGASQYVGDCLSFAHGQPVGSVQYLEDDRTRAWVFAALKAVGIREGAFHLEAIRPTDDPSELVFLEVANRIGGGGNIEAIELRTGLHLPTEELRIVTGNGGLAEPRWSDQIYGHFSFPGHHLSAPSCRIVGADPFLASDTMVDFHRLSEDSPLPTKITYADGEAPLTGIVRGPTTEELRSFLRKLFEQTRIEPIQSAATSA